MRSSTARSSAVSSIGVASCSKASPRKGRDRALHASPVRTTGPGFSVRAGCRHPARRHGDRGCLRRCHLDLFAIVFSLFFACRIVGGEIWREISRQSPTLAPIEGYMSQRQFIVISPCCLLQFSSFLSYTT